MRKKPSASPQRIALEVGTKETFSTLKEWLAARAQVARPWVVVSFCIALTMYLGALTVATFMPQADRVFVPMFIHSGNGVDDALWVLGKNCLVLLLHVLVCVAAYLARRAVPLQAQYTSGVNKWIHEHAGGAAMAAVAGFTTYSLLWQTWMLGNDLRAGANTLDLSPLDLLARSAVHGLPELTAVFLPLAACLLLGRKKQWNQMMAASILCTIIALPILVISAGIEVWATNTLF